MGGVEDSGRHRSPAGEVVGKALRRMLGDVGADFLVYAVRPTVSEASVPWRVISAGEAPAHFETYWRRLGPGDLPSLEDLVEMSRMVDQVDLTRITTLEQLVLQGSPLPVGSVASAPILHGGARAGSMHVVRSTAGAWSALQLEAVMAAAALVSACTQLEGSADERSRAIELAGRELHRSHILAGAARILMTDRSEAALSRVLEEVLDAVADTSVFVEINTEDEQGHPCIRLAAGAAHDAGYLGQPDYWNGMLWSRMPLSRHRLEQGLTHIVRRDALVGVEAETYAASRVGSELDVPIFAGGEWVGLVGLLSEDEGRDWSSEIPMMRTLGTLIAARFEQTGIPPVMAL